MANPGGNYPGRQISVGNVGGYPAFTYLVTSRSEKNRERLAEWDGPCVVRINPLDKKQPSNPFTNYRAVTIDHETGLLVVSNSEAPVAATFEFYKFGGIGAYDATQDLLNCIGPEYDNTA
jgi:IMP cyclohydrolase